MSSGVTSVSVDVASGVAPDPGVVVSDKDSKFYSAPVAISEVVIVAAPIAPHECVPYMYIDDPTRQISLLHGDYDATTDDFGSPPK